MSSGLERENSLENPAPRRKYFPARLPQFFPFVFFAVNYLIAWAWRWAQPASSIPDSVLLCGAAIVLLLSLNQRLPLQNMAGIVVTVAVFWWATLLIGKWSGTFLSPPRFRFRQLREFEFGILWLIGFVGARGIAGWILSRWRSAGNYGLWLIALSSALLTIEDPASRRDPGYLALKFIFAAAFFVSATPWFLDKRRIRSAPDFQPLLVMLLLFLW